jgi:hypothetical protein
MVKLKCPSYILLSTVNVLYHFSIQCTNHTSKGYFSIVQCLNLVLKCIIVPLVIYFKLMTNLRLFINYKKHDILLLFVISNVKEKINSEFFLLQSILLFACLCLKEGRYLLQLSFGSRCLKKRKRYS